MVLILAGLFFVGFVIAMLVMSIDFNDDDKGENHF